MPSTQTKETPKVKKNPLGRKDTYKTGEPVPLSKFFAPPKGATIVGKRGELTLSATVIDNKVVLDGEEMSGVEFLRRLLGKAPKSHFSPKEGWKRVTVQKTNSRTKK